MTASANKTMKINTREQAISDDINRLQQFLGADLAEVIRHTLIASALDTASGGSATIPGSTTSPLTGVILNGFQVEPDASGLLALSISGGTAFVVKPDGSPSADDSPCKFVVSGGLPTGTIAFSANAGPGIRIDVIEWQPVLNAVEVSSRNIYNPGTGSFSASSVTKVNQLQADFRIRQGTQGAGYPGSASGWMPLAVVAVPSTATNWSTCTFWDVRPLASDLVNSNTRTERTQGAGYWHQQGQLLTDGSFSSTDPGLAGVFEKEYLGLYAGGNFAYRKPKVSTDSETGFIASFTNSVYSQAFYVYAAFPAGLPRWVEYNKTTQRPGGFRGIPVFTRTKPNFGEQSPVAALTLPTSTGLSPNNTSVATCFFSGVASKDGGGVMTFYPINAEPGGWFRIANPNAFASTPLENKSYAGNSGTGLNGGITTFTFNHAGTHEYPANANALSVQFEAPLHSATANTSHSLTSFRGYSLNTEATRFRVGSSGNETIAILDSLPKITWQQTANINIPLVVTHSMSTSATYQIYYEFIDQTITVAAIGNLSAWKIF